MMEPTARIERLLTMVLLEQMKDASQSRKIDVLDRAGFNGPEIASILGTSAGVIRQTLYASRRTKRTRKK